MSDKTDKATVFEFAARYVHFLKGFVGNQHDKVKSAFYVIFTSSNDTLFYILYHHMSI